VVSRRALVLAAGAGLLALVAVRPTLSVPGQALDAAAVHKLAQDNIVHLLGAKIDPAVATTIAFIESSFNPTAVRPELAIGDASVGLMQTLVGTAQWLHDSMGYDRAPYPTAATLLDADTSMYYGAAYLTYLQERDPITRGRGLQAMVRGYNGGPGGAFASYTDGYWARYQAARAELF
jgi:soluble lytic murein transglycosylase-like protein